MRRFALVLVLTLGASGILLAPSAGADAPYQLVGTVAFVDGNGATQQLAVNVQGAGPPTYAGTGTVQWVTGLHPGIYTDIVKVDVDTTTKPPAKVSSVLFTISGEEWSLSVTDPGNGGTAHAQIYHLTTFPPLVAEGDVTSGGLQVTGALPPGAGDPYVQTFGPANVFPGGTVSFSGLCGTRPAPQAFTVNLFNVLNKGFYAGQDSISYTFPPGSNTGAYTKFAGTFPVPTGASNYTLRFVVTCYWAAPPYTDNTQGNGWYAVTTGPSYGVYVMTKYKISPWLKTVNLLAHNGLGSTGTPTGLQVTAFGGILGPPPTTTTTTTTRPPATVAPTTTTTTTPPRTIPTTTTTCVATPTHPCR